VFGVSERSVDTWWRAYRRHGRDGLATRKGRPGPAELISAEDRGTLSEAMADHTPGELLIGGPMWTARRWSS
jgi:transposase